MEAEIQRCAETIVARHCLFAGIAIAVIALALLDDPLRALLTAAVLNLMGCLILLLCATNAATRNYRRTELWLLVRDRVTLPPRATQHLLSGILRETYLRFARSLATASVWFFVCAGTWAAMHTPSPLLVALHLLPH